MNLKSQYEENGYFVYKTNYAEQFTIIRKKFISIFNEIAIRHNLDTINNDADINDLYKLKNRELWVAAYDQLRFLPEVLELSNYGMLLDIAKQCEIKFPITSNRTVVRADISNDKEYDFKLHQDYVYNQGSFNSITIWIPFQDTDAKLGALQVIPKSHKNGAVENENGVIVKRELEKGITVPLKLGEVLVFSQFLHHRSGLNVSKDPENQIRFSAQIRYADLSDQEWAKRKYYINTKQTDITRNIDYETHFHTDSTRCAVCVSKTKV